MCPDAWYSPDAQSVPATAVINSAGQNRNPSTHSKDGRVTNGFYFLLSTSLCLLHFEEEECLKAAGHQETQEPGYLGPIAAVFATSSGVTALLCASVSSDVKWGDRASLC